MQARDLYTHCVTSHVPAVYIYSCALVYLCIHVCGGACGGVKVRRSVPVTRPWLVAMAQQAAIDRVPGKGKCTGVDSLLCC